MKKMKKEQRDKNGTRRKLWGFKKKLFNHPICFPIQEDQIEQGLERGHSDGTHDFIMSVFNRVIRIERKMNRKQRHLFNKYLSSTYYMSATILGLEDTMINKT